MLNEVMKNDYVIDFRFHGPFNKMIIRVRREDERVSRVFENFTGSMAHTESEMTSILYEMMKEVDKKLMEKQIRKEIKDEKGEKKC